ncbi:MAG: hypothetical protein ACI854_002199 [Arenicella sp.]
MKKLIISFTVVAALLFFCAPYYTGKIAEAETLKLLDRINASSGEYGLTQVLSYERRVRSTNARYQYTPPVAFADRVKMFGDIIYACESQHGITGIDYICALEGESAYATFITENLDGVDPISVFGSISLFGGITQSISLDEIKSLEVDGATLNFPATLLSVFTDAKGSKFRINGNSDAFEMSGSGEKLSVGKMTIEGDFAQVIGSLFTGDMLINIDYFSTSGAQSETSIKGLQVLSSAYDNGDTLSSKLLFSIDQMTTSDAPVKSIESLKLGLKFQGLNKQSVIEYQEFSHQLQADTSATVENSGAPQSEPSEPKDLMPILEGMLKRGLEINANLNASLDGKPNSVNLDLKLVESISIEQLSQFISAPDDALSKLEVLLNASLDKGLIDSQPLAAILVARSPLVAAGTDNYALNLKLGSKIELNGKTISWVELQTLVFSSLPL